jgi:hypothetical protein
MRLLPAVVLVTACIDPTPDPPVVTAISITPAEPRVGDDLRCLATVSDPDGPLPDVHFRWAADDVALADGPKLRVTQDEPPGTEVTCIVDVTDLAGHTGQGRKSVTVLNSPPEITSIVADPERPVVGGTVSCDVTTEDADGHVVTVDITWTDDEGTVLEEDAIHVVVSDPGTQLTCTAVATDELGDTDEATVTAVVEGATAAP